MMAQNYDEPNTAKADPVKLLTVDVMNIVLSLLTPIDTLQCSLVSAEWASFVQGWMTSIGLRLHYPLEWEKSKDPKTYASIYKDHVAQELNFRDGLASSYHALDVINDVQVNGDVLVWKCHGTETFRVAVCSTTNLGFRLRTTEVSCFDFFQTAESMTICSLVLGLDGLLCLHAFVLDEEGDGRFSMKILSITSHAAEVEVRELSPILPIQESYTPRLLGRDRLYLKTQGFDGLGAYDFQQMSGELLYETSFHHHSLTPIAVLDLIDMKGEEFVMVLCTSRHAKEYGVRVLVTLRGSDGQVLQKFTHPHSVDPPILSQTPGNRSVFLTARWRMQYRSRGGRIGQAITVVRKLLFTPDSHLPFRQVSTDVLVGSDRGEVWAIHPSQRRAISFNDQRQLFVHDLQETDDQDILSAVRRALQTPDSNFVLGHCFVPSAGRRITIPLKDSTNPQAMGRRGLPRPELERILPIGKCLQMLDGGQVLFRTSEYAYLLDFSA